MSYSITHSKMERVQEIEEALGTRDMEKLFKLAEKESKEGNDEYAEILRDNAKRIDREDWQFDEARDNEL